MGPRDSRLRIRVNLVVLTTHSPLRASEVKGLDELLSQGIPSES